MIDHPHVQEAISVLTQLGVPKAQRNVRSGLCLLALVDLGPNRAWSDAADPLVGITPIMDWIAQQYGRRYAPNTRETIRRQTMHQFVDAGVALYNPDIPSRPVNSPHAVYQIAPDALELIKTYETAQWPLALKKYLAKHPTLVSRYAAERDQQLVPVLLESGGVVNLSSGEHSELIKAVIEEFAPRFLSGPRLIYLGDTGSKWGYFDRPALVALGVNVDPHGKMPDAIIQDESRNWLVLVEAVTSHGPVDGKRHAELANLFSDTSAGLIFLTAFPTRSMMARYLSEIAWETDVWVSDAPSHIIHFDGERFLGPY